MNTLQKNKKKSEEKERQKSKTAQTAKVTAYTVEASVVVVVVVVIVERVAATVGGAVVGRAVQLQAVVNVWVSGVLILLTKAPIPNHSIRTSEPRVPDKAPCQRNGLSTLSTAVDPARQGYPRKRPDREIGYPHYPQQ